MVTRIVLFNLIFTININSQTLTVIKDSTTFFEGDQLVSLYLKENDGYVLKIKQSDSTFLFKYYYKDHKEAYKVYQTDMNGTTNGYFYFYDSLKNTITNSYFTNGNIYNSLTTKGIDTVRYALIINDSIRKNVEFKNDEYHIWTSDFEGNYSGIYEIYNLQTRKLVERRVYKLIQRKDIKDMELFKKEYLGIEKLRFRIEDKDHISIKYGTWEKYNDNGRIIDTIKYNWDSLN